MPCSISRGRTHRPVVGKNPVRVEADRGPRKQEVASVQTSARDSDAVTTTSLAVAQHHRVYAPQKIAALVRALTELGADAGAVLAGTGLTPAETEDFTTRTSIAQLLAVARNAVRLVQAPDLGLRIGSRMRASSYGMWGYALLCAETMRHAFELAVRYQRLAQPVMPVRWTEEDGRAIWHLPSFDDMAPLKLAHDEYLFFLDMQMVLSMTLTTDAMGSWCLPALARYATPPPPHADRVAAALQCPVEFDQGGHELHYPLAWLDRAPSLANPITASQMSSTCARLMREIGWRAGLTRRVCEELTRVPGRFPDIESIAATLCMTSRTLRRKLDGEGTSYTELLANVRHALALDYLRTTDLEIDDVASALGFSDANAFRHAFKRWTGRSPG